MERFILNVALMLILGLVCLSAYKNMKNDWETMKRFSPVGLVTSVVLNTTPIIIAIVVIVIYLIIREDIYNFLGI